MSRFEEVISQHPSIGMERGAIRSIRIYITWAILFVKNSCG